MSANRKYQIMALHGAPRGGGGGGGCGATVTRDLLLHKCGGTPSAEIRTNGSNVTLSNVRDQRAL